METRSIKNNHTTQQILHQLKKETEKLSSALSKIKKQSEQSERIVLRDIQHIHFIKVSEIIYCRAERSYTRFFLENNLEVLVSKNLKTYESLLKKHDFFRIHNSYLINLNHIRRIDKQKKSRLVLSNQHELPVSKTKWDLLFQKLK